MKETKVKGSSGKEVTLLSGTPEELFKAVTSGDADMPVWFVEPEQKKIRFKGGAGSGHWGHRGRPGIRGGSSPGGGLAAIGATRETSVEERRKLSRQYVKSGYKFAGKPSLDDKKKQVRTLTKSTIMSDWAEENIERNILQGRQVEDFAAEMFYIGEEYEAVIEISVHGTDGVWMGCKWYRPGESFPAVGECRRWINNTHKGLEAHNSFLEFSKGLRDHGRANALYDAQIDLYKSIGVDVVTLNADISIGKYAWARRGFDFDSYTKPYKLKNATSSMRRWVMDKTGWSEAAARAAMPAEFSSAADVANFSISGLTFRGSDIYNNDVPDDMEMHVGKAFCLDSNNGLGSWDGELWLK